MKRILSVALILLLSASTLASCNPDTGSESGTTDVTDATGGSVTETATETQTNGARDGRTHGASDRGFRRAVRYRGARPARDARARRNRL